MLYIKKSAPSNDIKEMILTITKTDDWKSADEGNTELLRHYFDLMDKQVLRESIVREQHGLCSYCMKRIKPDADNMIIEHFVPIKGHKASALDYNNMLGSCKGGTDQNNSSNRVLCCDSKKEERELHIDPRNKEMMARIRYRKDGCITLDPPDETLQNEIDHVLGLNGKLDEEGKMCSDTATQIVKGRRDAYTRYTVFMNALQKKHGNNETKIRSLINKRIEEIENSAEYPEFAGVTLFFLKRRLREA